MSNIVVFIDEGTSHRVGVEEAPLQSFGPMNKGKQSLDMVNRSLVLIG